MTPPASKMQTRRRVLRPAGGFFCLRQEVPAFFYSFSMPVMLFLYHTSTVPLLLMIQFLYHSSTVKISVSSSGGTVPHYVSCSFDSTPIHFLYHFLWQTCYTPITFLLQTYNKPNIFFLQML